MQTEHEMIFDDVQNIQSYIEPDSVDLVVTSPPYPMIEMWDELFETVLPNETFSEGLSQNNGFDAFESCHKWLDNIWERIDTCLTDDAIVCINIGDATRKVDDSFKLFPNHSRITQWFVDNGYEPLPSIKWHKPTNKSTSYMGSGMIPPNAYISLETEYILVFRKTPGTRTFPPNNTNRYESAYFWEERNKWFSDTWDFTGETQIASNTMDRERTAAFPMELPFRLINMFSVYSDTILDPFGGTATSMLAAIASGRHSVSFEIDESFKPDIQSRVTEALPDLSQLQKQRLEDHDEFVTQSKYEHPYTSENYPFSVKTKQEQSLTLYYPSSLTTQNDEKERLHYSVEHNMMKMDT